MKLFIRFLSLLLITSLTSQGIAIPLDIPREIFIPEQYGQPEKQNNKIKVIDLPLVVLINDAHCTYEAQKNISNILDILTKDYGFDLIGVEGASGSIDVSPAFRSNPGKQFREKIADKYMKKGLLTASEALLISKGRNPGFSVWGIEDLRLYLQNYKAFKNVISKDSSAKYLIGALLDKIAEQKQKAYDDILLKFDQQTASYESDRSSISELIQTIYSKHGIPKTYKNVRLILKQIRIENKMDFGRVESERNAIIDLFAKNQPKDICRELITKSVLYKQNKIPSVTFYSYLQNQIPVSLKPKARNLALYTRLIKLRNHIDTQELLSEIDLLIEDIYRKLCRDKESFDLYRLEKTVNCLKKIVSLEAARNDITFFVENGHLIFRSPLFKDINKKELEKIILPAGQFYDLAIKRDRALAENIIKLMSGNCRKKSVLICGGFHSDGIKKVFKEQEISVIEINPYITKKQPDSKKIYITRIMDENIDPDKIMEEHSLNTFAPLVTFGPQGRERGLPNAVTNELTTKPRNTGRKEKEEKRKVKLIERIIRTANHGHIKLSVEELLREIVLDKAFKEDEALAAIYLIAKNIKSKYFLSFIRYAICYEPIKDLSQKLEKLKYYKKGGIQLELLVCMAKNELSDAIKIISDHEVKPYSMTAKALDIINKYRDRFGRKRRLILDVTTLVNKGFILQGISLLNDALKKGLIRKAAVPAIVDAVARNASNEYFPSFALTVTGDTRLREILKSQAASGGKTFGYRYGCIIHLIGNAMLISTRTWASILDKAEGTRTFIDAVLTYIKIIKYLKKHLAVTGSLFEAKRLLAALFLINNQTRAYRYLVRRLLASDFIRGLYSPYEFERYLAPTIRKINGIQKHLSRLGGVPAGHLQGGTDVLPLNKIELIDCPEDGRYQITENRFINLLTPDKLKAEIHTLINNEYLLHKCLPDIIRPQEISKIIVSFITVTSHTLVFKVDVIAADGTKHTFALKRSFGDPMAVLSDVSMFAGILRAQNPFAEEFLTNQYGEWFSPYAQDGNLWAHYRAEEYVEGRCLDEIYRNLLGNSRNGESDPEKLRQYKDFSAEAVKAYYILFDRIAKRRWFLSDATSANIMLHFSSGDRQLRAVVLDLEARIVLPAGITDDYFINFLQNRGFDRDTILDGIRRATEYIASPVRISPVEIIYTESV